MSRETAPAGFSTQLLERDSVHPLRDWCIAIVAAAVAGIASLLLCLRTPGVNGPEHWRWWYRDPPDGFAFWFVLAAASLLLCALIRPRTRQATVALVLTLAACSIGLRAVIALHLQPRLGLAEVDQIIRSDYATSYYYDGLRLLRLAEARRAAGAPVQHWLALYDEFLPQARVHTATKPAGGVIYWMSWRALVGHERAPVVGAIALMVAASFTPVAVWWLAIRLGASADIGLLAAALMALSPGFLLSTPSFDAAYPLFTCCLIITWLTAVERRSIAAAAASGALVAIATLMSLHLLCVGIAVVAAPWMTRRTPPRAIVQRTLALAPVAALVVVVFYASLGFAFDYSPFAVVRACFVNQADWARHNPEWFTPMASLYNLSDGALGVGWPVAVAFLAGICSQRARSAGRQMIWVAAATLALAAGAHLLPAETARVWVFLTPMVVLPAAALIDDLSDRPRMIVVLACVLTSLTTCAMLKFILGAPAPDP